MNRTAERENFLLIKIITIIFVVLLAVYIPLKIYIARTEKKWPQNAEVELAIYVTSRFGCGFDASECGSKLERLAASISRERAGKPLLIIETCGTGCCGNYDEGGFFSNGHILEKIKRIDYDAIAAGAICRSGGEEKLFRDLEKYSGSGLLLAPANVVSGSRSDIPLKKHVVEDRELIDELNGESVRVKTGLFCLIFADSIHQKYSTNRPFNIIDPKIAALEESNFMNSKNTDLVVALCSASPEESSDIATEIPGLDLVINSFGTEKRTVCRRVNGSFVVDLGNESLLERLTVTISADSLRVTVDRTETLIGG